MRSAPASAPAAAPAAPAAKTAAPEPDDFTAVMAIPRPTMDDVIAERPYASPKDRSDLLTKKINQWESARADARSTRLADLDAQRKEAEAEYAAPLARSLLTGRGASQEKTEEETRQLKRLAGPKEENIRSQITAREKAWKTAERNATTSAGQLKVAEQRAGYDRERLGFERDRNRIATANAPELQELRKLQIARLKRIAAMPILSPGAKAKIAARQSRYTAKFSFLGGLLTGSEASDASRKSARDDLVTESAQVERDIDAIVAADLAAQGGAPAGGGGGEATESEGVARIGALKASGQLQSVGASLKKQGGEAFAQFQADLAEYDRRRKKK